MTGWLVLAAYLCGWAFTARKAAFIDRDARIAELERELGIGASR